jgi:hypothetical protein
VKVSPREKKSLDDLTTDWHHTNRVLDGANLYVLTICKTESNKLLITAKHALNDSIYYKLKFPSRLTERLFLHQFNANYETLADHVTLIQHPNDPYRLKMVLKLPMELKKLVKKKSKKVLDIEKMREADQRLREIMNKSEDLS